MKRQILIVVMLLALFPVETLAAARPDDSIAMVVAVRGMVTAGNRTNARKLKLKSPIFKADIITTGKRGRIQILFKDSTIVSLARNTRMTLADYSWEPEAGKGRMKTRVEEGTFRIMGGAITKFSPKHFTTETPTATIGIRGSMYAGTVTANSLSVVFQGGKGIDIMNAAGSVAITRPGFGTHVQGMNQPPALPEKFSAADMAVINNALNGPPPPAEQTTEPDGAEQAAAGEPDGQAPADDGAVGGEDGTQTPPADESADSGAAGEQTDSGAAGEPPPPPDDAMPADGQVPSPDEQAPPPGGEMPPPDDQMALANDGMLPVDGALPPPGVNDQFGTGTVDANIDPNIDNIVTSASVDSSQTSTGTGSTAPSASLPTDGLSAYSGSLTGSGGGEPINASTFMLVNWRNHKMLGVVEDTTTDPGAQHGPATFFFGDIVGIGVANLKLFGSDANDGSGSVITHEVTNASGGFWGDSYQFFDFSATGNDYDIKTQALAAGAGSWNVAATTAREAAPPTGSVPTGTQVWHGFVVGTAENMNNPTPTNQKYFMNNDSLDFTLNVNKTNGTMTGSMSTDNFTDGSISHNKIASINIGGGLGSVYVRDDVVAAILGCTGNCIDTNDNGSVDAPIGSHGSYMITGGPNDQMSPYFTWGYWEAPFNDGTNEYHAHIPSTMWLAGRRTVDINSSYITTSFTGTYNGIARGVKIPSTGQMQELGVGSCHLDVDLASTAKATGYINFPNVVNLTIGGTGTISGSNAGFTTGITNMSAGTVNGVFFGPQANAVGGNFEAYDSGSGNKYMGIFGANR